MNPGERVEALLDELSAIQCFDRADQRLPSPCFPVAPDSLAQRRSEILEEILQLLAVTIDARDMEPAVSNPGRWY